MLLAVSNTQPGKAERSRSVSTDIKVSLSSNSRMEGDERDQVSEEKVDIKSGCLPEPASGRNQRPRAAKNRASPSGDVGVSAAGVK